MLEKPRKIGKYGIKSIIGEGATSVVYEGFDPDIVRRVAIKSLRPNLIDGQVGEELLTRFRREAISAARCIHPNVVSILEYGQHENIPYIVMEYVDGVSVHGLIKHRLKHGRGISLRRSLTIVSHLLGALHAAHKLGIVHRDVKASNVLIQRKNGHVKLVDFGMARITENSDLTIIGSLIGTPRYMAPELRLGLEADARADIFSAARLFLELLRMLPAGSPFPRSRLPLIEDMPPGNRIDYTVTYPTALIPVLSRGLQVDREKRYQTVQHFMQAIKQALPNIHEEEEVTVTEQIVPAAQEPVRGFPASEDELDTMTSLLAVFLGPAASIVMEEHETTSTSAYNLAIEISREIPEQHKQKEFLRRWGMLSASRQEMISRQREDSTPEKIANRPLPGSLLHRIGNDVAGYIRPLAGNLWRHGMKKEERDKKAPRE
jgi:serine/threonine-protein kinase